jgi:hypothetical protein
MFGKENSEKCSQVRAVRARKSLTNSTREERLKSITDDKENKETNLKDPSFSPPLARQLFTKHALFETQESQEQNIGFKCSEWFKDNEQSSEKGSFLKKINEVPESDPSTVSKPRNVLAEKQPDQSCNIDKGKDNYKSNFKVKIKICKEDLQLRLQGASDDIELSLEVTNSNNGEISSPDFINQITSKVMKELKNHFGKDKTDQNSNKPKIQAQKSNKPKLRKTSKTKSMQFLLEHRSLKRSRVTLKSNREFHKTYKKINDFKNSAILYHSDKENANSNIFKM